MNLTRTKSVAVALLSICVSLFASQVWAQVGGLNANNRPSTSKFDLQGDGELKKMVLVVKMDAPKINALRSEGVLTASIPQRLYGRVGAVRFVQQSSFLKEAMTVDVEADKYNQSLVLPVDNTIIERLDYQPVEIRVYESGFQSVSFKFNPQGSAAGEIPKQKPIQLDVDDSPIMYLRISEKRGIYGTLKGLGKFPVKTDFGNVKIPTGQMNGIKLNIDEKDSAYVLMRNGDEFSAKVEDQVITVNTWWGPLEVSLGELESITTLKEQRFVSAKNDKWRLQSSAPRSTPLSNSALLRGQQPQTPVNRFQNTQFRN